MNYTEEENEILDEYLKDNFNIEIYEDLIVGGRFENVFDPLAFFDLLYQHFEFFEKNQDNYLVVRSSYDQIQLEGIQLYVFLLYIVKVINNYHYSYDDGMLFFPASGVGNRIFGFIKKQFKTIENELFPEEEQAASASTKIINIPPIETETPTPVLLNNESHGLPDIAKLDAPLKQKILVLKYLDQFDYVKLNKIHQDRTKQSAILSFVLNHSFKTTYDALGANINDLKTLTNLTALKTLFEPLKAEFPKVFEQIETDLKNAK
jgi:hypothetical protein